MPLKLLLLIQLQLLQLLPDKSGLLSAYYVGPYWIAYHCAGEMLHCYNCTATTAVRLAGASGSGSHLIQSQAQRAAALLLSFWRATGSACPPKAGSGSARILLGWSLTDKFAFLCRVHVDLEFLAPCTAIEKK